MNPHHKPIMIVGEYWNLESLRTGQDFEGTSRHILKYLLRDANISTEECHFTNVFKVAPPNKREEYFLGGKSTAMSGLPAYNRGRFIHRDFEGEIKRLINEIERVDPNIIITLGNLPLWVLTGISGVKNCRGTPTLDRNGRYKIIPTWALGTVQRQWETRVVVLSDLIKARKQSTTKALIRPQRYIYLEPTIDDLGSFYETFLKPSPFVSCDIETKELSITEVGYSNAEGTHALVIPFYDRSASDGNYWGTKKEEVAAWDFVRMVNEEKPLIGQNFTYDMAYFWRLMGIPCPKFLGDSMILHHSLQPEMEKGLGFLASIYTNEPSWKFMRKIASDLKQGVD